MFAVQNFVHQTQTKQTEVVELVDTHVSGACVARHEGSSPSFGTLRSIPPLWPPFMSSFPKSSIDFIRAAAMILAIESNSSSIRVSPKVLQQKQMTGNCSFLWIIFILLRRD